MDLGCCDAVSTSSSSSSTLSKSGDGIPNCIEHEVSKFDTLAGLAIKYGVEVSDIKKMNGLTTDLQMFAHKTLLIPLPGRHPPSSVLSSRRQNSRSRPPRPSVASYESTKTQTKKHEKKPISLAMSLLQGYYGLPTAQENDKKSTEMAVYTSCSNIHNESRLCNPQTNGNVNFTMLDGTQKSLCNNDLLKKAEEATGSNAFLQIDELWFPAEVSTADEGSKDDEKSIEKSVRRRSKMEEKDTLNIEIENGLKLDGNYSARGSKGLSLRPKFGGKQLSSSEILSLAEKPIASNDFPRADLVSSKADSAHGGGDSLANEKLLDRTSSKVRRSSSTPSLQISGIVSPIKLASMFTSKADNQSSTSSVSIPIFDVIPRPMNGWRNKAALD